MFRKIPQHSQCETIEVFRNEILTACQLSNKNLNVEMLLICESMNSEIKTTPSHFVWRSDSYFWFYEFRHRDHFNTEVFARLTGSQNFISKTFNDHDLYCMWPRSSYSRSSSVTRLCFQGTMQFKCANDPWEDLGIEQLNGDLTEMVYNEVIYKML